MPSRRIDLLDFLRSLALLGMAAFHLSYDLLMFGLIGSEYAATSMFYFHARTVAATFIALAGVGLYLAHHDGIRWTAFGRRFAKILAAAVLVSIATRFAMPEVYVYFGILHAIALFSLLGLAVLRFPAALTALLAVFFVAGSFWLQTPLLDHDLLRFVGLSTLPAYTIDFEPIFPWFGAFLAGVSIGQTGERYGFWTRLSQIRLNGALTWPGRHSLPIYLIHQPVLLALVWGYTRIIG